MRETRALQYQLAHSRVCGKWSHHPRAHELVSGRVIINISLRKFDRILVFGQRCTRIQYAHINLIGNQLPLLLHV